MTGASSRPGLGELCDAKVVKAAFEVRLMCLMGYTPDLSACIVCGKEHPESPLLGVETGHICCRTCRDAAFGSAVTLCDASLAAMRYLVSAPPRRLFSFKVSEDALKRLSDASERYLLAQAGRGFSTLDYWKKFAT